MLVELLANGLLEGARIGLAGLGFALIFYTTKELHFAYGALLVAAGYLYYTLAVDAGVPAVLAVPVTLAAAAAVGALIQRFVYRRLSDHLAVLLFSFGLTIIIENALHIQFGPSDRVLPDGQLTETIVFFDSIFVRVIDLVAFAAFVVVWVLLWWMLERRRIGLAIRAVMRDPDMSELVGIRTGRIKVFAYALGSLIAAVAGLVTVTRTGLRPGSGFDVMLFAFIATLLGAGRMTAVALWSLGLGLFMGLVSWQFPTELRTLLAFSAMLVYLVVRSVDRSRFRSRRPERPEQLDEPTRVGTGVQS